MKTVVCYGDSNTWGFKPKPARPRMDSARFDSGVRWTCVLQRLLGSGYRVEEEGLSGRTTAFDDPFDERRNGFRYLDVCLFTKMPVDLIIFMLGTNDMKEYLGVNAYLSACGLERLIQKAKQGGYGPSGGCPEILVVSPAHLRENISGAWPGNEFGEGCLKKDADLNVYYKKAALENGCRFLDAGEIVRASAADAVHLDEENHAKLAEALYKEVIRIFE
jgi:lysophospholipase L1-like esterase